MLLLTQAQKNKLIENHKAQDGTKDFKAVVKIKNTLFFFKTYETVSELPVSGPL